MTTKGFTYTPVEFIEPQDFALHQDTNGWSYGVAATLRTPSHTPENPNNTDLAELPDTERIAWQQALNDSESGCRADADHQLAVHYEILEFGEELSQLDERLENHPDRIALDTTWANCLASHGHDFASRDSITSYLVEQATVLASLDALNSTQPSPPEGGTGVTQPTATNVIIDEIALLETDIATIDATCAEELNYNTHIADLDKTLRTEFLTELIGG